MNQSSPLHQALTSLTPSFAEKGDYWSIFLAFKSAMPEIAAKHLAACKSDEALAGAALAQAYGDSDEYAVLAHYLTGDANVVLSRTKSLMAMLARMSAIAAAPTVR